MRAISLSLTTLVLVILGGSVEGQRSCYTADNAFGLCVPYKQCSYLTAQLASYGNRIPQSFYDYLRDSRCGDTSSNVINICCEPRHIQKEPIAPTPTSAPPTPTVPAVPLVAKISDNNQLNQQGLKILSEQNCGRFDGDRVAFGNETLLAEFPWMALLIYDDSPDRYLCGGSLITNRYVLTAAHCIYGQRYELTAVRLGEHDTSKEIDCQPSGKSQKCSPPSEDIGVESILRHPMYTNSKKHHDIALVKLARNVEFQSHIRPVCLPITPKSRKASLNKYLISGWGTTETGSASKVLLKAVVPHQELEFCRDIFRSYEITENHICAGGEQRVDSCKGDSGGPLFFLAPYMVVPQYIQYGVVSLGAVGCVSQRTYPTLYTRVENYLPWITQNIV